MRKIMIRLLALAVLSIPPVVGAELVARHVAPPASRFAALPAPPPDLAWLELESTPTCHRFRWHGVLHEDGPHGYRGCADPEPRPVVALGDSFTWGHGVRAEEAWPALLGATNLGVRGENATDTRQRLGRLAPYFERAQTVVLGACLNDTGAAYSFDDLAKAPLLDRWAERFALLKRAGYGRSYRRENDLGWRARGEQTVRDWRAISTAARDALARPIAVVLATPETSSRALVRAFEAGLVRAGWEVVPTPRVAAPGVVSRWEAHPNAAAHRAFAAAIRGRL